MKFLIKLKQKLFTSIALKRIGSYEELPKVNFYSRFTKNTFLGKNCNFNGLIIRGKGKVIIGDNFHSGKNILLINTYHRYENAEFIPYDKVTIDKDIIIKDNVWIGDRVIILGGITIEEGAIIQAGAVVVNDVPKCAIVGGNPAKVFKYRNIDNYERLKALKKFY